MPLERDTLGRRRKMRMDKTLYHSTRNPISPVVPVKREEGKVGRNDPCPCGSGSKFKRCCMMEDRNG